MSGRFDWEYDELEPAAAIPSRPVPGRRLRRAALALLLLSIGSWLAVGYLSGRAEAAALASVTSILRVGRDACRAGDGEAFFSFQATDPSWRAALLRPELIEPYCAGLAVIDLQPLGAGYVARLAWPTEDGARRQTGFFQVTAGDTRRTPPPGDYGGEARSLSQPWGTLVYRAVDEPFAAAIAAFAGERMADICRKTACRPDAQPFRLDVRADYRPSAEPGVVAIASPQLLALDSEGQPAPEFWDTLEQRLVAHLTPGLIRFAVPPLDYQAVPYERAAAAFMARNPNVQIEIVTTTSHPESPGDDLTAYDAAAFVPTAAMIAAGQVVDVTDYAAGDPAYAPADFAPAVQAGASWRGRQWIVPFAGQLRLLFFDPHPLRGAGLGDLPAGWNWTQFEEYVFQLQAARPPPGGGWSGEWLLLDASRDLLYARAACDAPCNPGPTTALAWYREAVESGLMPDIAAAPPDTRTTLMANWQGVPRRAVLWVDDAVAYENHLQMWPVGVVALPGATPLWLHGGFISSHSERPVDAWRWLVFLSHQPLNGPLRYVPARSSVAEQTRYWEILPPTLRAALQGAWANARPIPLDERDFYGRDQLDAALAGQPVKEVAGQRTALSWFGR